MCQELVYVSVDLQNYESVLGVTGIVLWENTGSLWSGISMVGKNIPTSGPDKVLRTRTLMTSLIRDSSVGQKTV